MFLFLVLIFLTLAISIFKYGYSFLKFIISLETISVVIIQLIFLLMITIQLNGALFIITLFIGVIERVVGVLILVINSFRRGKDFCTLLNY